MTLIDDFTAALEAAVTERGEDYHYTAPCTGDDDSGTCVYASNGTPSCGIGLAVYKLDPELFEEVAEYESRFGTFSGGALLDTAIWAGDSYEEPSTPTLPGAKSLSIEDLALLEQAINAFQSLQDNGYSWGVAREAYFGVLDGTFQDSSEALRHARAHYRSKPVSDYS